MAADIITVTNRTNTIVPLARGVILERGGSHTYQQNDITNLPYIGDHLARAVAAGLVFAINFEGETLTPSRILAISRGIHAHTHDPVKGIDPLANIIGSGGGAGAREKRELLAGVIDGANKSFSSSKPYIPGLTRVYVNGLRQNFPAPGNDYVEAPPSTITFFLAPLTDDVLIIEYFILGSGEQRELLAGIINGVNIVFSTSKPYVVDSTRLYINGARQNLPSAGTDYVESPPTDVIFAVPPLPTDILIAEYEVLV